MRKIIQRVGTAGLAFALAGCGLLGAPGNATAPAAGPSVSITQDVPPSALIAVLGSAASGPAISQSVNATARSSERAHRVGGGAGEDRPQLRVSGTDHGGGAGEAD